MSEYIIKNCEQIHSSDNFCWSKNVLCKDCTDCVMKQIVELCKKEKTLYEGDYIKVRQRTLILSDKILELLDVQEVK